MATWRHRRGHQSVLHEPTRVLLHDVPDPTRRHLRSVSELAGRGARAFLGIVDLSRRHLGRVSEIAGRPANAPGEGHLRCLTSHGRGPQVLTCGVLAACPPPSGCSRSSAAGPRVPWMGWTSWAPLPMVGDMATSPVAAHQEMARFWARGRENLTREKSRQRSGSAALRRRCVFRLQLRRAATVRRREPGARKDGALPPGSGCHSLGRPRVDTMLDDADEVMSKIALDFPKGDINARRAKGHGHAAAPTGASELSPRGLVCPIP